MQSIAAWLLKLAAGGDAMADHSSHQQARNSLDAFTSLGNPFDGLSGSRAIEAFESGAASSGARQEEGAVQEQQELQEQQQQELEQRWYEEDVTAWEEEAEEEWCDEEGGAWQEQSDVAMKEEAPEKPRSGASSSTSRVEQAIVMMAQTQQEQGAMMFRQMESMV